VVGGAKSDNYHENISIENYTRHVKLVHI